MPYSWHLARVEDSLGNQVSYNYRADADQAGIGEQYLKGILYNGTEISFQTQPRPDVVSVGTGRVQVVMRERLVRIDVSTGGELLRTYKLRYQATMPTGSGRSLLREIQQYGRDAQLASAGEVTGGTAAMPVTIGTTTPGAGPVGSFEAEGHEGGSWGAPWPDHGFTAASNWDNESADPYYARYSRIYGRQWFPGDVDGDGRTDFVGTTFERSPPNDPSQPFRVSIHTAMPNQNGNRLPTEAGTGKYNYRYATQTTNVLWYNDNPQTRYFRVFPGDVNGDGRTDIVIVHLQSRSTNVWVDTGLSVGDGKFEFMPSQRLDDNWSPRNRWFVADGNGDGRADILRAVLNPVCDGAAALSTGCTVGAPFDHAALQVSLSSGDGTWQSTPRQETEWPMADWDDSHWFMGDANGDGRADFQRVVNMAPHDTFGSQHPAIQTALSRGDGTFEIPPIPAGCPPNPRPTWCVTGMTEINEPWQSWANPLPWLDQPTGSDLANAGDMDGDGRTDLVLAGYYVDGGEFVRLITAFSRGDGTYRPVSERTKLGARHLNYWWKVRLNDDHAPNRWLTGDWNGDGATDLMVVSPRDFETDPAHWPQTVSLSRLVSNKRGQYVVQDVPTSYYFDCQGRPEPPEAAQCPNDLSFAALAGDVNGDGQDDFMYAGGRLDERPIQRTYFRVQVTPTTHEGTTRWRTGDINGDGRQDLLYPQYTRAGITIQTLLRRRDGLWQRQSSPVLPTLFNPVARNWIVADVGSLTGGPDGRADLVYVENLNPNAGTGVRIYTLISKGDGTWSVGDTEWPGFPARDIGNWRPADIDGDGDTDLIHIRYLTFIPVNPQLPVNAIRVDVLRSNGNGTWTPISENKPNAWNNFGAADTLNWKMIDVNRDGRVDLVHLDGRNHELQVRTLLANGDGTWQARVPPVIPGTASDVRGWDTGDVNADGRPDLIHLDATGGDLRSLVLLGSGDGIFTARAEMAWPGFGETDIRRWLTMDVNADGGTDLVHLEALKPGLRVSTLLARPDGTFSHHEPVPNVWPNLDTPDVLNWHSADIDGDTRADMVRVDYSNPGLTVLALKSTAPMDLVTTVDNGVGNTSEITYRPSSEFAPTAPAAGATGCHLPHGVVMQLPASVTQRTGSTAPTDRVFISYICARWSYKERRLLGWAETSSEHAAAQNRPALVTVQRYQLDDTCFARPVETRLQGGLGTGGLFSRTVTEYPPTGPSPAICLPERVRTYEHNQTPIAHETETTFHYDAFGNADRVSALGWPNDDRDDRVTEREFKPATAPWLVSLPATETLHGGPIEYSQSTQWCYDGDNGTHTGGCPGVPTKGLVTAVKALDDNGQFRTTKFGYDRFGNQTSVTDPLLNTTTTIYEPKRNIFPQRICNALNQCEVSDWDLNRGLLKVLTDANAGKTELFYDPFGRSETTKLPNGAQITRTFLDWNDPNKRRIRERIEDGTPDGLWSETYLDGLDRVHMRIREGDASGQTFIQHTFYTDASDRPAVSTNSFTYPATVTPAAFERFNYDALGRPTSLVHADQTKRTWLYGNHPKRSWVTATDERGNSRTTLTDAHGRLSDVEESDGIRPTNIIYTYDVANHVRTIANFGNVMTYGYDRLGNVTSIDDPDRGLWKWSWDAAGNLKTQTDARGIMHVFGYDKINRVKTKTYSGETIPRVSWFYEEPGHGKSVGRLTSISDPTGEGCQNNRSRSFTYDTPGRITEDTRCVDGYAQTMDFEFDALDRYKAVIYPDKERVTYGYDSAGRLRDMSGLVGEFNYDADGRMTRAERADSTVTLWDWDAKRHWLNSITTVAPGTGVDVLRLGYTYESDGLVKTGTATPGGPNLSYIYDGLDRLTHVNGDLSQSFTWNTIGNLEHNSSIGDYTYPTGCMRDGKPVPCPRPHAAETAGGQNYKYDANGNTIAIYDSSAAAPRTVAPLIGSSENVVQAIRPPGGGFDHPDLIHPGQKLLIPADPTTVDNCPAPPTSGTMRCLQWDDDNRLSMAQDESGTWTRLLYDSEGNRVEKRQGSQVTRYFGPWLDDEVPGAGRTKYYWADSRLIARRDAKGVHFYHQDHLGSTRALTSGAGTVDARYKYQPFGQVEEKSGQDDTGLQFTGRRYDPDTGLTHMGARYYDPTRARFLSPDPMTPRVGSSQALNRYQYAFGNPLKWTDPTGEEPECSFCDYENDIIEGRPISEVTTGCQSCTFGLGDLSPPAMDLLDAVAAGPEPGASPESSADSLPPITEDQLADWGRAGMFSDSPCPSCHRLAPGEPIRETTQAEKVAVGLLPAALGGVFAAPAASGAMVAGGTWSAATNAARALAIRLYLLSPPAVEVARRIGQGLTGTPSGYQRTPQLTYRQGFELGSENARRGAELVLGKFPGNVEYVNRTIGTVTLDVPVGWTPMYNAGFVRGFLEEGGLIRFTSHTYTGTFALEAQQIFGIPGGW